MEVPVKNSQGGDAGTIELADFVWAQKMNGPVLHQVVVAMQANQRQGGHDTRTRGEVIASSRKLRAQKHTGRARLGDRGSPTMRGGGVAHGPHPRSYRQNVPAKVRNLAFRVALSDQLRRGNVTIVDDLGISEPKTRALVDLLAAAGTDGRALVVTPENDEAVRKSANNIPGVDVQFVDQLNALQAYSARHLVVTRAAAEKIDERWGSARTKPARQAPAGAQAVEA